MLYINLGNIKTTVLFVYLWNLKWPGDDARWEGGSDEKRENRPAGESVAGVSFPFSALRIWSQKVPKYCQETTGPTCSVISLQFIRYFKTVLLWFCSWLFTQLVMVFHLKINILINHVNSMIHKVF